MMNLRKNYNHSVLYQLNKMAFETPWENLHRNKNYFFEFSLPLKSKRNEFWNMSWILRFFNKNESENRENGVTWGHVTLRFFSFFSFQNFNAYLEDSGGPLSLAPCQLSQNWATQRETNLNKQNHRFIPYQIV